MGKKVLAAKSGRAACSCAAAGGGVCSVGVFNAEKQSSREAKSFLTGLTGFTGLREASVKPAKTKPSGVEWIGDIPEGWEVRRLKSIFEYRKGLSITKADLTQTGIPVISYGQIHSKKNTGTHLQDSLLRFVPLTYLESDGNCLLKEDDFVFADTSEDLEGLGNCVYVDRPDKIFAGYHTIIFRPYGHYRGEVKFRYLAYLFKTDVWRSQFRAKAFGIKVYSLSQRLLNDCYLILPTLPVQRAIAAYLDEKCGAIDAAVAEAKKGIEEYKAWKISLIDDIVCNGIDRHRHRKETGEVWLADIPIEWDFIPIRYLFALRDERNDRPLKDVNLISLYTDKGVVQHSDIEKTTGNKASTADGYKLVYENDIVVNIILCWMGAVGRSAYNGVTSPAYDVYRPIDPTKVLSRYYHYLFRTPRFNGKCYEEGRGIMMMRWRTYSSEFRAIKVPVPSLEEQRAIAAYLDEKCAAIDKMVAEKEALIADLEAYKKSLIFEVVTGKREVASNSMVK